MRISRHHVRPSRRRATFRHQRPIRAGHPARPRPVPAGREGRPCPAVTAGLQVRSPGAAADTCVRGDDIMRGQGCTPRVWGLPLGPHCLPAPLVALWTAASSQQLSPAQGQHQDIPRGCSICSWEGRSLWIPWGQPSMSVTVDTPPQSWTGGSKRPQGYNKPPRVGGTAC